MCGVGKVFKVVAQVFNSCVRTPGNVRDLVSDAGCFVDGNLEFGDLAVVKTLASRWDSLFKTPEYSASLTARFFAAELSFFS